MSSLKFALANFGPILVFYVANHFLGLKAAVLASIVWTVGDVAIHRMQKKPLTTFFKFSAGLTMVFGLVDLYLQQSVLFKYEAALSNFLVGIFFALSLFDEKPIIRQFAEAQGRISKEISPEGEFYFRFLTVVWSAYSFAKAIAYVWVASHYTLEQGLVIRGVVGNATFYGLLLVSIFGAKQIKFVLRRTLIPRIACAKKASASPLRDPAPF